MKKSTIGIMKVTVFIAGFCLIFWALQSVLHYHWSGKEDLYSINMMLKTVPSDSYDVLYFGTSELKTAVFPALIFQETGITGYNLSTTNKSAMTAYYQLAYALRYQKPKVVCCDFSALYDECLPSDRETIYRKVSDTMPDRDLKWDMIYSIKKMEPEQSMLSYLFPMLRYHSIWNELTEENFQRDYVYREESIGYDTGCTLVKDQYEGTPYEIVPEIWQTERKGEAIVPSSMKWYNRFIELCHENGIIVVALLPPDLSKADDKTSRWNTTWEYFCSQGVDVIDYNTYEAVHMLGLLLPEDYLDNSHMSYLGTLKVSRNLAYVLKERYQLPDHRSEERTEEWDKLWSDFCSEYEVPSEYIK